MIAPHPKYSASEPMESEIPSEAPATETAKAGGIDPREVLRRLQEASPTFRDCKPLALGID